MSDTNGKAAARARRFDAELAAVLGVPEAAVVRASEPARPVRSWLAAALVLLGVLVTIAVAWQQRSDEAALQDPRSLEPPAVPGEFRTAERAGDLADWPRDLRGAHLWLSPGSILTRELTALEAFPELQLLGIHREVEWTIEGMAPLGALRKLEVLSVPVGESFTPEHCRVLARLPALRFLTLELQRELRSADVDALAALPALRSLTVSGGRLDAVVVRHLATLPHLQVLALKDLDVCTEEALCALQHVRRLRRLQLEDMGRIARPVPRRTADVHKVSAGLTPKVAGGLAQLPELRSVTLTTVEVTAAAIEALPAGLEHIGILASPQLGPDIYAALARFPRVRRLDLDAADRQARWSTRRFTTEYEAAVQRSLEGTAPREEVWQAQARMLAMVAPREVGYVGAIPTEVRERLVELPLTSLALRRPNPEDVAVIAGLPGLRNVTLEDCELPPSSMFPLREVPNLLHLTLRFVRRVDLDELRTLLPNVTVTTHGF